MAKKKPTRKWNKTKEFARKKSTRRAVGHPVFIYGKSGRYRKHLIFTHKPERGKEGAYDQLKHNIDPGSTEKCYVKKQYAVTRYDAFDPPDRKYAIHKQDADKIKKYAK